MQLLVVDGLLSCSFVLNLSCKRAEVGIWEVIHSDWLRDGLEVNMDLRWEGEARFSDVLSASFVTLYQRVDR